MTTFLLLPSPLMRDLTWSLVAEELEKRGYDAVVPTGDEVQTGPFWSRYVTRSIAATTELDSSVSLVLVGHSGAGPLLPVVLTSLSQPVVAAVFVDAGLPVAGTNRLDLIRRENPDAATVLEDLLRRGGSFPNWDDATLRASVPDAGLRSRILADMNPRRLDFFEEPLPVPDTWPNCPCAYLQFSPGYDFSAQEAASKAWPIVQLQAGHFHMLVDPSAVTSAVLGLIENDLNIVL